MSYLGQIEQYISEIDSSQNIEDICCALRKHLEPQGFECFTYALLLSPRGPLKKPIYISTYPADWVAHYIENQYPSKDLVNRYVIGTLRPFLWNSLSQHDSFSQTQRKIFNEATEFKIQSGGSLPIHGPGQAKASFAVASYLPENEFAQLFLTQRHELHLVATYAHERILDIGLEKSESPTFKLSPREIDVLIWTAQGKTAWEISKILSLSEDTVKGYIKGACRKLNTNNKTHAIAVALMNGLIIF